MTWLIRQWWPWITTLVLVVLPLVLLARRLRRMHQQDRRLDPARIARVRTIIPPPFDDRDAQAGDWDQIIPPPPAA